MLCTFSLEALVEFEKKEEGAVNNSTLKTVWRHNIKPINAEYIRINYSWW